MASVWVFGVLVEGQPAVGGVDENHVVVMRWRGRFALDCESVCTMPQWPYASHIYIQLKIRDLYM